MCSVPILSSATAIKINPLLALGGQEARSIGFRFAVPVSQLIGAVTFVVQWGFSFWAFLVCDFMLVINRKSRDTGQA